MREAQVKRTWSGVFAAAAVLTSIACSLPTEPGGALPGGQPTQPARDQAETLVTAVRYEPVSLASKPLRATGSSVNYTIRLFNAELVLRDARDAPQPYLAESLPQLNTDTWRVFPDGKMETTYRLKPNLTWHDRTPLTAEDFVFAWRVYTTRDFGYASSRPQNLMENVAAPDPRTVVIQWNGPYPEAGQLATPLFQALPRHVLEPIYRQRDPDGFVNHPFWSNEYIGAGPYRLERWEPGAFIEGVAFDGHVLGRPKIERVVVRSFTDENTALTNVLADNVQFATDRALRYEHIVTLKREWGSSGHGVTILTPTQWRYLWVQQRPDTVEPRAFLDVRTRQALAHAIDKEAINGLFDGEGALADTLLPRTVPYYADIDRAIMKYPYDLRRSEQLMAEVGYTKASDGIYVNASGERFTFESWGDSGSQFEKDLAVVGDGWRRAGFEPQLTVVAAAQFRDTQYRTTFTGVYSTTSGAAADTRLDNFASDSIPSEENRWSGSNYPAWSNPEFDRLWQRVSTTLDRAERDGIVVQMMRIVSQDAVLIPLYHNFEVLAHFARLRGPDPNPVAFSLVNWNVHEWELD
ncbi:MAG: hypothetical protein GEU73_11505 [Chloroflexi bacterium]|nr:hypothetical protein [Chloroflexota bacterium]